MPEIKRTFGCLKSKLTGYEPLFRATRGIQLFDKYDLRGILEPIRDQGEVSKCVSVSLTDMVYYKMNMGIYEKVDFRDDIFYNTRPNQDEEGMYPVDAFNYLIKNGINENVHGSIFARVKTLNQAKCSIIANGPLMACIMARSYNDDFWNGLYDIGGHAVLFVGWTKTGFILRNSWGTEYGDSGYTIYPFSAFKKGLEYWTLIA